MKDKFQRKRTTSFFFYTWLMLLVLLAGSLSGCGKENPEKNTGASSAGKGRFLESEIALPEDILVAEAINKRKDNTIELLGLTGDGSTRKLYTSADNGASWEEKALPEELSTKNCLYTYGAAISPEGEIFVSGSFGKNGSLENWIFDGQGNGKKLSIPLKNSGAQESGSEENFISEAEFSDSGSLYAADMKLTIYQINTDTGEIEKTIGATDTISVFNVSGTKVFYQQEGKIKIYDEETGEEDASGEVSEEALSNANADGSYVQGEKTLLLSSGSDGFFYGSREGIFYCRFGGTVSEQLLNGELCSLGNPNVILRKLWYIDEEHFLVWVKNEEEKDMLLQYSYSKDAAAVPEKEIKVYALKDSAEIRTAAAVYQKEHDDTYVNLSIGKNGDAATTADALRTLNSDIMAGNGPDVIILDGIPADNYIDKGLLLDITDVMENAKKDNRFFENLCGVYAKDGKIYGIPSRFLIPFIQGEQNGVDASGDLTSLAGYAESLAKNGNKNPLIPLSAKTLLGYLFDADAARWISGDKVDENGMRQFYEAAKKIYDANTKKDDNLDLEEQGKSIGSSGSIELVTGDISLNMGTIGSDLDFMSVLAAGTNVKDKKISYSLFNGKENHMFIPVMSAGISSKSKNVEEAKSFIQTMLSESIGSVSGSGLPVNKDAYEKLMDQPEGSMGSVAVSGENGSMVTLDFYPPKDSDVENLTDIIDSLDTPALGDTVIREQVLEQGERFLSGSQSLDETVRGAMQKIQLYLSE